MVTLQTRKRLPSKNIWIRDIIHGDVIKGSGWDPSYIELNGQKISRVNIIATVVSKFISEDGNYGSVTLDDGSETIRVKAFGPDVLKIKQYNEESYLSPEIIRSLEDPNWLLVHKLSVGKPITELNQDELKIEISSDKAEEQIKRSDENISKRVLDVIREISKDDGALFDDILEQSGLDAEEGKNVIISLLKSGDVYEPKKGRLKVLD